MRRERHRRMRPYGAIRGRNAADGRCDWKRWQETRADRKRARRWAKAEAADQFAEVEQPASPFVLRLREKEGGIPQVALFEGGDARWKVAAMQAIAETLQAALEELGVENVPILE